MSLGRASSSVGDGQQVAHHADAQAATGPGSNSHQNQFQCKPTLRPGSNAWRPCLPLPRGSLLAAHVPSHLPWAAHLESPAMVRLQVAGGATLDRSSLGSVQRSDLLQGSTSFRPNQRLRFVKRLISQLRNFHRKLTRPQNWKKWSGSMKWRARRKKAGLVAENRTARRCACSRVAVEETCLRSAL